MCIPALFVAAGMEAGAAASAATAGSVLMAMGSTAMGVVGQNAQISAQNKAAAETANNAVAASNLDYSRMQDKNNETAAASNLQQLERQRQGMRERSRMRVAMGLNGVEGNTPMSEFANSYLQQAYDSGITQTNTENAMVQNQYDKMGVYATAKDRVNSARSTMRTGTSPLLAGLQIAAAGAGAYTSYKKGEL